MQSDVSPKNTTGVLEKFAITINVQLTLQPGQEIPFIPFNGFDKVKEASKYFCNCKRNYIVFLF